ncbi:MAG: hypothetical protein ABI716_00330 [Candidatus Saccharibacteria bacterium]
MKKNISIIGIIGSLFLILDSMGASHWVLLFVLAGVIPGTDIHISAIDMMAANATAIVIIILRVTAWPQLLEFFLPPVEKRMATKKHSRRHTI